LPKSGITRRTKDLSSLSVIISPGYFSKRVKKTGSSLLLVCRQVSQEAIYVLGTESVLELDFIKSREQPTFLIEPRDKSAILKFTKLHFKMVWNNMWIDYTTEPTADLKTASKFQTPSSLLLYMIPRISLTSGKVLRKIALHVEFVIDNRSKPSQWDRTQQHRVRDALFEVKQFLSGRPNHIKFTSNGDEVFNILPSGARK
jgi:hypothetical protein